MEKESSSISDDNKTSTECTVCLQPFVQPVKLPCNHVFCFLCAKGLIRQNNKCALCRKDIPSNYIKRPKFVVEKPSGSNTDSYCWYYQGQNGWWQYDDQTNGQIEHAYQNDEERCELLIAGEMYIIDFEKNRQILKCNPIRSRHIKRDLWTTPCKGVAGVPASLISKVSVKMVNDTVKIASPTKSSENSDCSIIVPKTEGSTVCVNVVGSSLQNLFLPSCSNSTCSINGNLPTMQDPKTSADDATNNTVPNIKVENDLSTFVNSVPTEPAIKNTDQQKMQESEPLHIRKSTRLQNAAVDNLEKQLSKRSWTDTKEQDENEDPSTKRVNCSNPGCIEQDPLKTFGAAVVSRLQEMTRFQKLYAQKIIYDALLDGLSGKLSENSRISS